MLSMLQDFFAQNSFLIGRAHLSDGTYTIYRVELMHMVSSENRRHLKKCLIEGLSDENVTKTTVYKPNSDQKTYKKTQKTVLSELNELVKNVTRQSPGFQLHVNISKGEWKHIFFGLFDEEIL